MSRQGFRYFGVSAIAALSLSLVAAGIAGSAKPLGANAAVAPCTVQWGTYEPSAPFNMAPLAALDTKISRHSDIVHWYTQWGASWGTFAFSLPGMNNLPTYTSAGVTGSTPLLTWEAQSGSGFPLTNIAAGNYDPYIDSWANGLKSWGRPFLIDPFHEMDGNWYPWGYQVNGNTPAQLVAAYRHVHDRFVLAGATNVQFVWNVNVWNSAAVDQRVFYPGDAYVDWMAIDVYNWGAAGGGWSSLADALNVNQGVGGVYSRIAGLSNKPIMLAEWASAEPIAGDPVGVTKGQWTIDAASALGSLFTRIKAVVWFSYSSTFPLDSSAGSLAGALTAFGGCNAPTPSPSPSPIPTPSPSPIPSPTPPPTPQPESLGGVLVTGPAASTWGAGRMDVFARGTDNQLYHRSWNGTAWSTPESIGGYATSDPAAVSWGPNRIDVFARGWDNAIWHKFWNGSTWSGWETLGGNMAGGPEAISWGAGRLDVFARGADNQLKHIRWNGTRWSSWENLGGVLTADPAAVTWGQNRMDAFIRGSDNGLYHMWWDGNSWSGWESLGGYLTSGPGASTWGPGRLDVFALGSDSGLYRKSWSGSWSNWQSLGGQWKDDPAAISRASGKIDVFARGTDNALWHIPVS